jgi:hypothetical protein
MVKGFGLSASKHDRAARAVPRTRRTTYAASSALIGKNTVASPQVVNGSLQTKDLSAKARKALKGNRGLRGAAGARGATGASGAKGATGSQGLAGPGVMWALIKADGTAVVA